MKKVFLSSLLCSCFLVISVVLWTGKAYAPPPGCAPVANNLNICQNNFNLCTASLTTCNADLEACVAESQIFPGDGVGNDIFDPDLPGHGPALSYSQPGTPDGTFTDDNTGLMWEIKDDAGGIHDKDTTYTWTDTCGGFDLVELSDPDGTLFTMFLDTLNTTCDGAGVTDCVDDSGCGVGEVCGFAGYQDWRIPNVKELQSIVDYSVFNPSSSVPGLTRTDYYFSATTVAFNNPFAWIFSFSIDGVSIGIRNKCDNLYVRAVRP